MKMRMPSSSWFRLWPVPAFFGGVALVVAGIALIYAPAAMIVLGLALVGVVIHESYFK